MKGKNVLMWIGLVVLAFLVSGPGSAAAQATRTKFTGIEEAIGPPVDYGDWTYPGGNVHVRGMTTVYQDSADDPRVSGRNTVVTNGNWGPDGAGPMWGTSENHVPDSEGCPGGGVWRGTWTGIRNADASWSLRAVGKGVSGCVAGLHYSMTASNAGREGAVTTYTGEILDPHGE